MGLYGHNSTELKNVKDKLFSLFNEYLSNMDGNRRRNLEKSSKEGTSRVYDDTFDQDCIDILRVKDFTPCESSIYALMGKIHKRLNMHAKDMFYFGIALDLKPPAADVAAIKSAMEKLHLPDELEDNL
ncbi:cell division cycle protein 27 homolog B-like isoform X2 [Asparagus officinalis]|uniref:cell division cycle protein 27 homolog B-like isoform X2 n=1 Tax=Asparagus officinalis TaxID=4686 RepID=UPI00098E3755|nr:cell division cycle protein 27 homolog B-like isoform X2 [Asparagus officinalis]